MDGTGGGGAFIVWEIIWIWKGGFSKERSGLFVCFFFLFFFFWDIPEISRCDKGNEGCVKEGITSIYYSFIPSR